MQLYIMRHAQASITQSLDGSDRGRTLTAFGLKQAVAMGQTLHAEPNKPELILSSPYHRTLETARLVAEQCGVEVIEPVHWLASGMSYETALKELNVYKEFSSIVIVAHQPDIGYLLEHLSVDPSTFWVEQGAVFSITGQIAESKSLIQQLYTPKAPLL